MKLFCKCGKQLTKDICKTTRSNSIEVNDEDYPGAKWRPGFFKEYKKVPYENNKWSLTKPAQIVRGQPAVISVAEEDVVLEIPPMIKGYGCCNWSFGSKLKCSCGNTVAMMYLDCYEDKSVDFIEDNVVRSYK